MSGYIPYILALVLAFVGIYCIVSKKNVIKIVIGLVILEYAANLFIALLGYVRGGIAPIVPHSKDMMRAEFVARSVDPLPQALIVTATVIGLGVLALAVALAIRVYEKYGTFDVAEIRRLKG